MNVLSTVRRFMRYTTPVESQAEVPQTSVNMDSKKFNRTAKHYARKFVQAIVQSRLSTKVTTECRSCATSADWFCLSLNDDPEVLETYGGELQILENPVNVEISLLTSEGQTMYLETWSLHAFPPPEDNKSTNVHVTYTRLGGMLKALISATRVVPAYTLSRRQGPDAYIFRYRIYTGPPELNHLGEDRKTLDLGHFKTAHAIMNMQVVYRTVYTFTPNRTEKDNPMMVKSDHFKPDCSPKRIRQRCHSDAATYARQSKLPSGSPLDCNNKITTESDKDVDSVMRSKPKPGAFAAKWQCNPQLVQKVLSEPEVPFSSLIRKTSKSIDRTDSGESKDPLSVGKDFEPVCHSRSSSGSFHSNISLPSSHDEFIMVDPLRVPFANSEGASEVHELLISCKKAPPLPSTSNQSSSSMGDEKDYEVATMLQDYEEMAVEFDNFASKLLQETDDTQ